jgi:serine protease Do
MLSRSSAVIISLTSLSAGIVLGILLGRGGPVVSAQVAGSGIDGPITAISGSQTNTLSRQKLADDATYDVLAKQYEQFQHINRTFELVAKAVSPSVVHIVAQKTLRVEKTRKSRQIEETGSGVIIRSDRVPGLFVLTNHHVVDGSEPGKIRVLLSDSRSISVGKVWTDSKADIAVLNLDRDDLPAARLGNSDDAPIGTWVMALGSPFGLRHSVSQGIISARGRQMDELSDIMVNQDFIQTDAAINPGNSGGPLVNMKGEVIAINNSIASNGGGNEGVGFSIPINMARWIMNALIVHGRVTRGALGVDLHPDFPAEQALSLGMDRPRGAWIKVVYESTAAAKAGLLAGDVVVRFAGVNVIDLNHLINMVSMAPVGEPAEIVIWRDRRELKLKVTVDERERTLKQFTSALAEPVIDSSGLIRRPNRPNVTSNFALGLELSTLNPQLAQRFGIPESWRGVLVMNVDPDSPLARLVQQADVISAIDNEAIQSSEQAVKILNQRADHVQSIISLDRPSNGDMQHRTVRLP